MSFRVAYSKINNALLYQRTHDAYETLLGPAVSGSDT